MTNARGLLGRARTAVAPFRLRTLAIHTCVLPVVLIMVMWTTFADPTSTADDRAAVVFMACLFGPAEIVLVAWMVHSIRRNRRRAG